MTGSETPPAFRLAYVPGVTPGKWVRAWDERSADLPLTLVQVSAEAAAALVRDRDADAVLLRLPVEREGLHAIPLYTETTVVVVPKDHLLTAGDEVTTEDLADSVVLHPLDDTLDWEHPPGLPAIERPETTGDAVELVAAGVGVLVVPQSLARLHHRRDLTYRPVPDAPQSQVALSWLEDETTDAVERFIGVIRGRTGNSTRGRQPEPEPAERKRPEGDGRKPAAKQVGKPAAGKQAAARRRGAAAAQAGKRGKPRRRS